MKVTDKNSIRQMNELMTIKIIVENKSISRADISKQTGLNKASVSSIVGELIKRELVEEIGDGESSGGRKPILVKIKNSSGYAISIDAGENYISSATYDLAGEKILEEKNIDFEINEKNIFSEISKIVDSNLIRLPKSIYGIFSVTVALHGVVKHNSFVFSPFYDFSELNLKHELEKKYDTNFYFENEANLAAIGEKQNIKLCKNIISVSIHTGIGAGIIINNNLIKGKLGYAGEVGHTIVVLDGKKCSCGNKGCIEQYASEKNILKSYSNKINLNSDFEMLKKNYLENNFEATECINDFIKYIGILCNNLAVSFDPEIIILNSRFFSEIDGLIEKINLHINCKISSDIKIVSSTLGDEAILIGGFIVSRNKFLERIIFIDKSNL